MEADERKKAEIADALVDFALDSIMSAAAHGATCLLEFPEDLGSTARGDPASLWQRVDPAQLPSTLVRGAIYQCQ